jgi:exopolysaccharide biosynthesis polyprenyl glycosylphosphotransferase
MTVRSEPAVGGLRATRVSVPYPFVERRTARRVTRTAEPLLPQQRVASPPCPPPLLLPQAAGPTRRRHPAGWLVLADGFALVVVGSGVQLLTPEGPARAWRLVGVLAAAPLLLCTLVALSGGYHRRKLESSRDRWGELFLAALGTCVVVVPVFGSPAGVPRALTVLLLVPSAVATVLLVLVRRLMRAGTQGTIALLAVGDERLIVDLVAATQGGAGLRVIGACVPGGRSAAVEAAGVPVLGDLDAVPAVARRFAVDAVGVTACAEFPAPSLRRLSWDLEGSGVRLVMTSGLVGVDGGRLTLRQIGDVPFLALEEPALDDPRRVLKGALDRVVALLALLLLSPVLLAIAVTVRATSPGPAMFGQTRVGRHGKEFTIWKFRSMHEGAEDRLAELRTESDHGDGPLFKVYQDRRVTPFGAQLRRWSLDELPQLINVLRGEMSLVGPRPPLPSEVGRYDEHVHRRLLVTPGMTGSWQVNGRSDLSWDDSIRLDLRYVEDWSLGLDLRLVCQTFAAVLRGRGAY